jgi:hypothetical protein
VLKESKKLELFQLANGMIVPSKEGRLYCSRRDPVKESEKWYQDNERAIQSARQILVLGLGAGFHLLHFSPEQEIYVLELDQELIDLFLSRELPIKPKIHFVSSGAALDATVLEFRPAWLGKEDLYESLSLQFRNLTAASLRQMAEKKDLWVLAEALQAPSLPENLELTVKEIANLFPLENQTQEAKIWRALRELVV